MREYLLDIGIILTLIFINGVLAMAELAIVSSNPIKLNTLSKNSRGSQFALELKNNPGSFLSTIQIGITIIGIFAGAYSGQKFAEPMGIWLNTFSWVHNYGNFLAFTVIIALITYISILLGELIPKRIAIIMPEKVASSLARPILYLSKITFPLVYILDVSTKKILKVFNLKVVKDPTVTEDEIQSLMLQGLEEGAIDNFEHKLFHKILQFGDRDAEVIMTPIIKVIYLDIADSMETNLSKILQNPHRYYPVFNNGLDNFEGILDTKDALADLILGKPLNFQVLVKEAPCVIENNLGPELLDQFKFNKSHFAIVIDEYGSVRGVLTLVDLFETLVGSIPSSSKEKHYKMIKRDDGSWLCDGLTPIHDIEELLEINISEAFEDNDFNTLAGFLLVIFKCLPKEGEQINWNRFRFEILDMDGARIDKIMIKKSDTLTPQ